MYKLLEAFISAAAVIIAAIIGAYITRGRSHKPSERMSAVRQTSIPPLPPPGRNTAGTEPEFGTDDYYAGLAAKIQMKAEEGDEIGLSVSEGTEP